MRRVVVALLRLLPAALIGAAQAAPPLPQNLRDTGLYSEAHEFAPRYPLWSDGTQKRRWLYLPPGTAIDRSNPDAWEFPIGTKAWKDFAFERRIETRYLERLADGSWRFATYLWNEAGTEALLAPAEGTTLAVAGAPGGRYRIPSRTDCLACHEGAPVPVLGYSALQLSGIAPSSAAATPTARAALGYLHGNCGHCHNHTGPLANLELALAQQAANPAESAARTLRSLAGRSGMALPSARMRARNPFTRMPPLGVSVIDQEGAALVEKLVHHLQTQREPSP